MLVQVLRMRRRRLRLPRMCPFLPMLWRVHRVRDSPLPQRRLRLRMPKLRRLAMLLLAMLHLLLLTRRLHLAMLRLRLAMRHLLLLMRCLRLAMLRLHLLMRRLHLLMWPIRLLMRSQCLRCLGSVSQLARGAPCGRVFGWFFCHGP